MQNLTFAFIVALVCIFGLTARAQTEDAPNLNTLFQQAQDAHEKKNYAQAVKIYDAIIAANAEVAEIHFQRAAALASLKRDAEAEASYRQAIELKPEWAESYVALADLIVKTQSDNDSSKTALASSEQLSVSRATRLAEAEKLLQKALALEPTNKNAVRLLPRLRALSTDTASASELLQRARLALARNNTDEANANINQVLALDASNLEAFALRLELQLKTGNLENTLADVQKLENLVKANRSLTPEANAKLNALLAHAYAALGEHTRRTNPTHALAYFLRANELDSNQTSHLTGYAATLVQLARYTEAITILKRIVEKSPDDYAAHANLATALDKQKRYAEALNEYLYLKKARPEIIVTDYFIARMHDQLQDYVSALAAYESFLQRADATANLEEIERVKLRLTTLREQAKKQVRSKKR